MGISFSKKSVRQAILELEQQIEEQEKEIRAIRRTKESAGDLFFKSLSAILIGAISILWVCKESISYIYTLKIMGAFFLLGTIVALLFYIFQRVYAYRLKKKTVKLERLKERQKRNIENLKKETKYDETHGIIKRYTKHTLPEEDEPVKPDETVVDRLARLI
ncbi:hypothetical protein NEAUS03_1055 [Nematocida ausubeli]|nr:hypothetical protein NEAUS03_1055 [Nematocida ausubeli]